MLNPLSAIDAERMRSVFQAANYTEAHLKKAYGLGTPIPSHHDDFETLSAVDVEGTEFNGICRLFFWGLSLPVAQAQEAIGADLLESCVECGLLEQAGETILPQALLVPLGDIWLASDLFPRRVFDDVDYVPTVSAPARLVIDFLAVETAGRMLDLCGGCGLHGIHASQFSDSVVTCDFNPNAKRYVEFNAVLNECGNIEARVGDLFEPVQGERFDLILSNPPFVITPSENASFRGSPLELDGFFAKLVREAPEYLEEGGYLQTIGEWVTVAGEDWQDRLRGWVKESGCDVWVLQANLQLPESYASRRLAETVADPDQRARQIANWLDYFASQQVDAIYGGLVFLHKRSGENWFSVTELRDEAKDRVAHSISDGFACRELLYAADSVKAILGARLHAPSGIERCDESRWDGEKWANESVTLRLPGVVPVTVDADPIVVRLIEQFEGTVRTEKVLAQFAESLGMPTQDVEATALPMLRSLIETGFLVPTREST